MFKKLLAFLLLIPGLAFGGTVTGVIATPTGGVQKNLTLTFTLNAPNTLAGSFTVSTSPGLCYTDFLGNVVGLPNPLAAPVLSQNIASGTLPAATYFVKYTWAGAGGETAPSPESQFTLTAQGTLIVAVPVNPPAGATSWKIYISTSAGTETLQGTVTPQPFTQFSQSAPLGAGSALPSSNTTVCSITFNDSYLMQPNYYLVGITTPSGSKVSGISRTGKVYFFGGASGTVNISNGLPDFNGQGIFPTPIVSSPAAGAQQTINGALSLGSNPFAAGSGTFTNTGVFTNTQMNDYLSVLINGGSSLTEWTSAFPSNRATEGIAAVTVVPNTSTVFQSNTIAAFASNASTTTATVAAYAQSRALANGVRIWGSNDVVMDGGFAATMEGHEVDCNVTNTSTTGGCLSVGGAFTGNPGSFPAFNVGAPVGGGTWASAIQTADAASLIGVTLGAQGTGTNKDSQAINLLNRDAGGVQRVMGLQLTRIGNFLINNSNGGVQVPEVAAPAGIASNGLLWADSTAHRWKMNDNNAGADVVLGAATTDSVTNKNFTGATTGNTVSVLNAQGATSALTGNAADQVVYTYSLPANTADTTSKGIEVSCALTHNSGTANPAIKINLNGVNVVTSNIGTAASQSVATEARILRTGTTTAGAFGFSNSPGVTPFSSAITGLAWASAQTLTCTFNVANTDQVTGVMFLVKEIQ